MEQAVRKKLKIFSPSRVGIISKLFQNYSNDSLPLNHVQVVALEFPSPSSSSSSSKNSLRFLSINTLIGGLELISTINANLTVEYGKVYSDLGRFRFKSAITKMPWNAYEGQREHRVRHPSFWPMRKVTIFQFVEGDASVNRIWKKGKKK